MTRIRLEYLSKDPIRFNAGDANLYRYVGNGPTNATDPSGLEKARETFPDWRDYGQYLPWSKARNAYYEGVFWRIHQKTGQPFEEVVQSGWLYVRDVLASQDRMAINYFQTKLASEARMDNGPRFESVNAVHSHHMKQSLAQANLIERYLALFFLPGGVNPHPVNFDGTIILGAGLAPNVLPVQLRPATSTDPQADLKTCPKECSGQSW